MTLQTFPNDGCFYFALVRTRTLSLSKERTTMATGTVKWFNADKGYGFIQPDGSGNDVFVHATALEAAGIRDLPDGQKVSYEVTEQRGKSSATQIELV